MTIKPRSLRNTAAVFFVAVVLNACAPEQGSPTDLAAINQLRQQDMDASKKLDVDTLATLWTDDIVTLGQDEPPLIGKDANKASMMKLREESRGVEITEYVLSFNEVKISGDWAFEWGTYAGTVTPIDGGEPVRTTGKLIRVLKKDSDGRWRIARAMYNSDY